MLLSVVVCGCMLLSAVVCCLLLSDVVLCLCAGLTALMDGSAQYQRQLKNKNKNELGKYTKKEEACGMRMRIWNAMPGTRQGVGAMAALVRRSVLGGGRRGRSARHEVRGSRSPWISKSIETGYSNTHGGPQDGDEWHDCLSRIRARGRECGPWRTAGRRRAARLPASNPFSGWANMATECTAQ